ncbi:hypothetical protein TNCV_4724631 [Trichonephila clavipes]|uniref:Uncharacterized protein n=1 Tax=Trichonephila clavipes TaxID=2585209 RepID=A0A8X6W742_TRICX|nr:hypothetical protein TNCV_4724631 [Trichonephila clavipes]
MKTTQLVSSNETTQLCTAVNRLQPPATAYNRLQPPTTAYNRLQPPTTAYNRLQPPTTACNRLQPPATAYNRLQPPAPPAPPLQQNRLFLPTHMCIKINNECQLIIADNLQYSINCDFEIADFVSKNLSSIANKLLKPRAV